MLDKVYVVLIVESAVFDLLSEMKYVSIASDLMVFDQEFKFSPSENVNDMKNRLFLNHPLSSFA